MLQAAAWDSQMDGWSETRNLSSVEKEEDFRVDQSSFHGVHARSELWSTRKSRREEGRWLNPIKVAGGRLR